MLRNLIACVAALLWALPCVIAVPSRPALAESPAAVASEDPLAEGRRLELQQRWQEAIACYERLQRKRPELSEVQRRLQIVRIHHDVWRRYTDESFIQTVDASNASAALELYGEVLGKLELYYVEKIDLRDLLRNGTAFLEVALTESDFLRQSVAKVDPSRIEHFRVNVHRGVLNRSVADAAEAQRIVAAVATEAQRTIGASRTAVVYEYIAGAVGMLDPYSAFLTGGEYAEIMSQIEGNLIGVGVELWADEGELEVVDVFADGPAAAAGVIAGDRIVRVAGSDVSLLGAKRAADLLRGQEGSTVDLTCLRADGSRHECRVTRRRIEVPSVTDVAIADTAAGVGYLRITNFQKTTAAEVDQAMVDLANQGMRALIIDLRRNPGGLLDAAVDLADRFLERGRIVSTRGRNGSENHNFVAHYANTLQLPLMVMIDEDSASASEIFAGAIADNDRGVIVGRTSYGKGSVQGVFHNDRGAGGLRLTVSKFYSPDGYAISSRGVIPHVVLSGAAEEGIAANDELYVTARAAGEEYVAARPIDGRFPGFGGDAAAARGDQRRQERADKQAAEDRELRLAVIEARRMMQRLSAVPATRVGQ